MNEYDYKSDSDENKGVGKIPDKLFCEGVNLTLTASLPVQE